MTRWPKICWAIFVVAVLLSWRLPGWAAAGPGGDSASVATLKARYRHPVSIPFPEDAPLEPARWRLGQDLFFDPLLSRSGTTACATCHNPGLSWGDGLPRAVGDQREELPLRSPTLLDIAWLEVLGWDGKFAGLEEVTFAPIMAAGNMNLDPATLIARLTAIPGYVARFEKAFGNGAITKARIETALATYERTLVSPPAPFDRWVEGHEGAISESATRGFVLFNGAAGCANCHSGWSFTDGSFHDIGSAQGEDIGRGRLFPTSVALRYAFKTPTLRDVARRAPYMHDGSVPTLAAVIDLYDKGGIERPSRSLKIKPLGLSAEQKADLIAFLGTLTSDPDPIAVPRLPR